MLAGGLQLPVLLEAWTPAPVVAAVPADSGTINRTFVIETRAGHFFLRAYRPVERLHVEREHRLIAHARGRGLPVPAPIPTRRGGTILEREGRFYALFPPAAGRQVMRGQLTPALVHGAGTALARVHRALRDYPPALVAPRSVTATNTDDRAATIAEIDRLERVIRSRPEPDGSDRMLLGRLVERREWLRGSTPPDLPDLSQVERQVVHGDYQDTNLFFHGDEVSAIIDWDQSYAAPRAWEVVRTLHLVWGFAPDPSRRFIEAYRAELALPLEELDVAGTCYGEMRAQDLWAYRTIYDDGDDRPRRFFRPGPFRPLSDGWAALRSTL